MKTIWLFAAWLIVGSVASAQPIVDEPAPKGEAADRFKKELAELNSLWGGKTQVGFGTTNSFQYPIFVQSVQGVLSLDELEAKFKGKRTTARVVNNPGEYLLVLDAHSEDCETCKKWWPWQMSEALRTGWVFSVMRFGGASLGVATRGGDYEKMVVAMGEAPKGLKSELLPQAANVQWQQSFEFGNERVLIFGGLSKADEHELERNFRDHASKTGFVEGSNASGPEGSKETFFVHPRGGAYFFETGKADHADGKSQFFAYFAN